MSLLTELFDSSHGQLRLFVDADHGAERDSDTAVDHQLPFLQTLCDQLEQVTGWQVGFSESRASYLRRHDESQPSDTVFGRLEVEDLSSLGRPALRPAPRKETDQLVETLDQMIRLIQEDRDSMALATTELARSVDLPFDGWRLSGVCGVAHGGLATWAVDRNERVLFLTARVDGDCPVTASRALAEIRAAFRVAVNLGAGMDAMQREVVAVAESRGFRNQLQLALVSFDPIVGQLTPVWIGKNRGCGLFDFPSDRWTRIESEFLTSQHLCLVSPVEWDPVDRTPDLSATGARDELLGVIDREWVGHPWLALVRD